MTLGMETWKRNGNAMETQCLETQCFDNFPAFLYNQVFV
jgi:hypothetical protein